MKNRGTPATGGETGSLGTTSGNLGASSSGTTSVGETGRLGTTTREATFGSTASDFKTTIGPHSEQPVELPWTTFRSFEKTEEEEDCETLLQPSEPWIADVDCCVRLKERPGKPHGSELRNLNRATLTKIGKE